MSSASQQEQNWTVLMECVTHWRIKNRIPRERVLEMREELERHLQEAAKEGKPAEDVVGPDVHAFAEEWGAPQERRPSGKEAMLELATFHFTGMTVFLTALHLWKRSLNFTFNPRKYAGLTAFLWATSAVRAIAEQAQKVYGGQEDQDRWPLWKRLITSAAYEAGASVSLLGVNLAVQGGRRPALSKWSWRATAVILAASVALLILRGRDPITPEELGFLPEGMD